MMNFIPLSVPNFSGNEKKYASDAVISEWVSTGGSLINGFEEKIAAYVGMPRAVACNSGSSGLHLAMLVAGIHAGHEVIAPALTFIAAVNPIRYANAQPVFIGCDDSLCIDPAAVRDFCQNNCHMQDGKLINNKTQKHVKAMTVVHVFGNMADMESLMDIAKEYHLVLIEDATEAIGTYYESGRYKGKMAGTIGDVGVYSFNGNKILTTGSGGMLVSNHADWAEHAKHLSTQAKSDELQFMHDEIGYNYRLNNVQAALGLAQLEQLEAFIAHKHKIYDQYKVALDGKNGLRILPFKDNIRSNKWFYSLYLDNFSMKRDELIAYLNTQKIQTRPVWALINEQKPYANNEAHHLQKAEQYREKIVNLPCSTNLSPEDAQRVIDTILSIG
ncbi:MAG: LegC family aminotransferase [Oscillospiraceae bacterium]|nr:LegC family aminotransferase [Oscillospiraceae bacterium]